MQSMENKHDVQILCLHWDNSSIMVATLSQLSVLPWSEVPLTYGCFLGSRSVDGPFSYAPWLWMVYISCMVYNRYIINFPSLVIQVISVAQIQLFIFCWWDLHFHVFPHSGRLGIGVTEGECFVMLICLTGAIFGADVYTTVITPNDWKQTPDFVQR